MKKLEFSSCEDELQFLRSILEKVPAMIGIQQFDDLADPTTNHNIWVNQQSVDFLRYSREEMDELGFRLFLETMHPGDMEMIGNSLMKFGKDPGMVYGGVYRLKPKDKDYKWVIGALAVMEMKDGRPWRFLNVTLDIDLMKDTQNQIIALTRENTRLRNQIEIGKLTRREKQVIKLITEGKTDKEISRSLYISILTVKTHRHNIHRKLRLQNTASLVHFAVENGLS